jgi:outer membrane protein assembly factor BamB
MTNTSSNRNLYLIPLLVAVLIYLLIQGASMLWNKTKPDEVFALIPENAVLALEVPDMPSFWHRADSLSMWRNLKETAYFQKAAQRTALLDSLLRQGLDVEQYLKGKEVVMSLHIVAKGELDYLFFVPVTDREDNFASQVIKVLDDRKRFDFDKREYQGVSIHEISKYGNTFSYIFHDNYFIGSFTPFLVEDVIRNTSGSSKSNFANANVSAFEFEKIKEGDGHLYLNFNLLAKLVGLFSNLPLVQQNSDLLGNFSPAMSANFSVAQEDLQLNGIATADDLREYKHYLSIFQGQRPTELGNLLNFIPKRTALFYRLSFDNNEKFYESLRGYWAKNDTLAYLASDSLENQYNFNSKDFFEDLRGEIALATLESLDNSEVDKLLFAKIKNPAEMLKRMNHLSQSSIVGKQDSSIYENYAKLKIVQIGVPELPEKLFGRLFNGFQYSYFTIFNDYLVIGNSFKALRNLLNDVNNEQVWAKLDKQKKMLGALQKEENFTLIVNTLRCWNILKANLGADWQEIGERYKRNLLRFEFFTYQASLQAEAYKSTAHCLHRRLNFSKKGSLNTPILLSKTSVGNSLTTKPFIVKNHTDKSREILVQDSKNVLHLISSQGKKLWSLEMGAKLLPDIYQVDMLNNEKLQYLVSTNKKIYVIDRLGRILGGFPIDYPFEQPLERLGLIDYDKTKSYRFGASDMQGNIYVFTKDGKTLSGWNPRRLLYPLAMSPTHVRVGTQDCIIAIQANGVINLFKRNGEMYSGFPMSFENTNVFSNVYLQYGTLLSNTLIILLSSKGDLIKVNLLGQVVARESFARDESETYYSLGMDEIDGQDWIIARQSNENVSVIGKDGKLLFEKNYANASNKMVQYFNFGTNLEIFAVTDKEEHKTYLYYINGDSLTEKPLDSDQPVSIFYSELYEKILIYKCFKNEVQQLSLVRN